MLQVYVSFSCPFWPGTAGDAGLACGVGAVPASEELPCMARVPLLPASSLSIMRGSQSSANISCSQRHTTLRAHALRCQA